MLTGNNNKQEIYMVFNEGKIGDVLITTPLCKEIKKYHPNCKLLYVGTSYTYEVLSHIPEINEIIIFDKNNKHKGILGTLRFLKDFKYFNKVDYCFIVHRYHRGTLLSFLFRAKHRISDYTESKWYKYLLTDFMYKDFSTRPDYLTLRYANYINFDGGKREVTTEMSYKVDDSSSLSAEKMLAMNNKHKKTVGIFFNNWFNAETISNFVEKLNEYNYLPVLMGTNDSKEISDKIDSISKAEYINLIGKTTLSETFAVIEKLSAVVTVDTGSMHMAVALNKPTIVLTYPANINYWIHKNKCTYFISNDSQNKYKDIELDDVAKAVKDEISREKQ